MKFKCYVCDAIYGNAMNGCVKCGSAGAVYQVVDSHPLSQRLELLKVEHLPGCAFLFAATCACPVECEHGRSVCPICDPCTCEYVHQFYGELPGGPMVAELTEEATPESEAADRRFKAQLDGSFTNDGDDDNPDDEDYDNPDWDFVESSCPF